MDSRELALVALRVLSACTHGKKETNDVKTLRAHCLPEERSLATDELGCIMVGRCCAKVKEESKADRTVIDSNTTGLRKVG